MSGPSWTLKHETWNNERMRQIWIAVLLPFGGCSSQSEVTGEWISLFDGESLKGWTANENRETFRVEDGLIVAHGPRSHLYYTGPVADHNFKNFELEVEVMTTPGSNSGLYFHTEFEEEGWPAKGYEAQVNNSHTDPRLTGSLYGIENVLAKRVRRQRVVRRACYGQGPAHHHSGEPGNRG